MPLIRGVPDWALYAGGGLGAGGAYLLYRKRKSSAASGAAAPSPAPAYMLPDTSGQQSSIVPYYLTGGTSGQGTGMSQTTPGWPTPATPPGGDNVSGGGGILGGSVLPPIPPLLPPSPAAPVTPPPGPAPTQVAPPPAPAAPAPAQNNNIPADLLAKITAAGEKILGGIPSPNGGMWWLGSKGGVFAINAPFYGAPAGQSYWGSRTAVQISPQGAGYQVKSSSGETYNYG